MCPIVLRITSVEPSRVGHTAVEFLVQWAMCSLRADVALMTFDRKVDCLSSKAAIVRPIAARHDIVKQQRIDVAQVVECNCLLFEDKDDVACYVVDWYLFTRYLH